MNTETDHPPQLNIRFPAVWREALERAAKTEQRRVTDLARVIIVDWLREHGHLTDRGP